MKANELMTGAFVYFNCSDGSKIVVCVTGFKDGIVYGDSENGSHWCNIEKVEPIPVTQEILEKNGFIANKHVYPYPYYEYEVKEDKLKVGFAFPQGNKTSYKDHWVYIDSEHVFVEHLPCMFVHQLQYVLGFCGIYIPINNTIEPGFIEDYWVKSSVLGQEVEYTRTDVFIEKAWDWIEDNILSSNQQDKSLLYYEQFKNYIKK